MSVKFWGRLRCWNIYDNFEGEECVEGYTSFDFKIFCEVVVIRVGGIGEGWIYRLGEWKSV